MAPQYPIDIQAEDGIGKFIASFYAVSDTPGKNEDWLNFYADDATLVMANDRCEGREEILKLRHKMWEHVAERTHTVEKVFPARFQPGRPEFMLFGRVDYVLRTAQKQSADWAGHAILEKDEKGDWKFAYYRVYIQR